jgi:hypothetical protein
VSVRSGAAMPDKARGLSDEVSDVMDAGENVVDQCCCSEIPAVLTWAVVMAVESVEAADATRGIASNATIARTSTPKNRRIAGSRTPIEPHGGWGAVEATPISEPLRKRVRG